MGTEQGREWNENANPVNYMAKFSLGYLLAFSSLPSILFSSPDISHLRKFIEFIY